MNRILAASAMAIAACCGARAAQGEARRPAALSWVRLPGAETCISGPKLAALVADRLGKGAIVAFPEATLAIEGRIERTGDGAWRATLVLALASGGSLGTRELSSRDPSCSAMDGPLALVLAVLIDPDASPGDPPAKPADPTPAPTATTPPLPVPFAPTIPIPMPPAAPEVPCSGQPFSAPPPPAPEKRPPWKVHLSVGPALSFGLVPVVGAGAAIRAAVTPPGFWTLEGTGMFAAPQQATSQGFGGAFSLVFAGLGACPLGGSAGPWRLFACAGFDLGSVRAAGVGLPVVLEQEQWIANLGFRGRIDRQIAGPLFIGLGLGLQIPLVRGRFYYIDGSGGEREVFLTSPIAGLTDLSLGVELP